MDCRCCYDEQISKAFEIDFLQMFYLCCSTCFSEIQYHQQDILELFSSFINCLFVFDTNHL